VHIHTVTERHIQGQTQRDIFLEGLPDEPAKANGSGPPEPPRRETREERFTRILQKRLKVVQKQLQTIKRQVESPRHQYPYCLACALVVELHMNVSEIGRATDQHFSN
jgi:hypothetical protein